MTGHNTTITTDSVASGYNYCVYVNHEQHSDGPAESTAERIIGGWAPSEQGAKQAAERALEAQA